MIRDITLGQYYQTESVVHRLDPRTKLIATFAYLVSLFLGTNIYVYVLAFAFLAIAVSSSRVPVRYIVRGMKAIVILMLLTVVINIFVVKGEPILTIGKLTVTREGVRTAAYMALRLTFLVMGASVMTLTTTPNQLTDALESILKPLRIFKFPVHEIAMMMSIALRFIPILIEETDKIMKAQLARGADFESGNVIKKAKSLVPVLVPLFISAFRRANDLALAMEARCYRGGEGRTKMKPLRYAKRDAAVYLYVCAYLVLIYVAGHYIPKFW